MLIRLFMIIHGALCPAFAKRRGFGLDEALARGLSGLFAGKSVGDFGAGFGRYVEEIRKYGQVSSIVGYDGMPDVEKSSKGLVRRVDFTSEVGSGIPVFDWVLSLDVGEHIPPEKEDVFITNVCSHSREGAVVSWAESGRGGHVITRMSELWSLDLDPSETESLRMSAGFKHFKKAVMLFKKRTETGALPESWDSASTLPATFWCSEECAWFLNPELVSGFRLYYSLFPRDISGGVS